MPCTGDWRLEIISNNCHKIPDTETLDDNSSARIANTPFYQWNESWQ
jgi:hypothetical protein